MFTPSTTSTTSTPRPGLLPGKEGLDLRLLAFKSGEGIEMRGWGILRVVSTHVRSASLEETNTHSSPGRPAPSATTF